MDERKEQVKLITQRLRIIFRTVQAHAKSVEKECGLSSAKLWMLQEIAENPGVKVSKLAADLFIHPSTCSNMLGKLEEKELVCRDRSKKDQRTVHLHITDHGRELLDKAPKPLQGRLTSGLEKLSNVQLTSLEHGLEDLITVLQGRDDQAALIPIPGE